LKKNKLKIIIFDGSFNTRPFINSVIIGLSPKHRVYVLGFDTKIDTKIKGVEYVALGSNANKLNLLKQSFSLTMQGLLRPDGIAGFFKMFKAIFSFNTTALKHQNFNTALKIINPDIVHIQWLSLLPYCEKILSESSYATVLSQLGYQLNVRACVDNANRTYLEKWYPKINGFHSVSKAIKEQSEFVYTSENKIDKVIYSGFNFNKFENLCAYNKSDKIDILSVGRPHWIKGYDYMIKACLKLKDDGVNFHYTIVGAEGSEELLFLVKALNLHNEITLTKPLSQDEVYRKMSESSLLVLPSIAEGIANVVIEAMSIGLPVLSTMCGGVVELITDNKTGFLVPIRNYNALYEKIKAFKELNLEELNTIRFEAKQKVEQQHRIDKMIIDFEELYNTCLQVNNER
jgi:colanic acid/amylovoran biosynthesis glycosyltransferase